MHTGLVTCVVSANALYTSATTCWYVNGSFTLEVRRSKAGRSFEDLVSAVFAWLKASKTDTASSILPNFVRIPAQVVGNASNGLV